MYVACGVRTLGKAYGRRLCLAHSNQWGLRGSKCGFDEHGGLEPWEPECERRACAEW